MKATKPAKLETGNIGGRGNHPADPTGEVFGPTHWPLPQEHEKTRSNKMVKYMVIDLTTIEDAKIVAVAPMKEAQLIGKILQAQNRRVIAPPLEGRGFAKLEMNVLQYIFWNMTKTPPTVEYAELLKAALAAAEEIPLDEVPLHELEKTVRDLYPDEGSSKSSSGPKEPKTPKEPGAPADRPKATSTTGRVWELADVAYAAVMAKVADGAAPDWSVIRAEIIKLTDAEQINKATAATQYSKWKSAKLAKAAA